VIIQQLTNPRYAKTVDADFLTVLVNSGCVKVRVYQVHI